MDSGLEGVSQYGARKKAPRKKAPSTNFASAEKSPFIDLPVRKKAPSSFCQCGKKPLRRFASAEKSPFDNLPVRKKAPSK
ncbi:hypothetical protein DPMN_039302 [Dreissena polymorpha]|jgi:hypothetical protein|uniref:Uncharacterized protein n=1 Tax=Dreissena polymorpha TaxID=45954 RepID=A0A9D4EP91_DREPO|nr:hypothetical protein DPMN_192501 [Dreissena polymorpha]KAH3698348.1 hypothetical protein DPMN_085867 [Dreissena polymorpha]KAH3709385.1 hypothetical protein DPMN_068847 [Dreissena polymorpha]KAH3716987.1 hypothetical protein DPMN_059723 [Dreissena polymorpha]KAH3729266.1 hypothetical protein DPMN_055233 [Dreissena polymorpha]